MSDNLRRYRAIRDALTPWYPGEPKGNLARHLTTLAALISGIVASKSTQLPKVAAQVPDGNKPESRVKRFTRWVGNDGISEAVYFLPYADVLLARVALQSLALVIDGSVVGHGCIALMIHVVYKGRALPLCWLVRHGKQGHFPEDLHIALVEQVQEIIPLGTSVVLLGDGEFDGTSLQQSLEDAGWSYVCRTGCNLTATWEGMTFRLDILGECLKPGNLIDLPEAFFTAQAYGPVRLICCWAKGYQDPLYVVTNMASAEEACRLYSKRFRIETFFSDQKSRGFHVHKSHLSDPKRLSRLLIAACLAYIWIIYLGSLCVKDGWTQIIHRTDRCDLSLFQLGLRLLDHFLNENLSIPVAFHIPSAVSKSVR
jgi:Transposase DDE domain